MQSTYISRFSHRLMMVCMAGVGTYVTYRMVYARLYGTNRTHFGQLTNSGPLVHSIVSGSQLSSCDAGVDPQDRPYLGCSLRSMMDQLGMMVLLVSTESPAWHADMKVGDILLEIDGRPINKI